MLAVAIESVATADLDNLLTRTARLLLRAELLPHAPEFPAATLLRHAGYPLVESNGRWLSLHDFGDFDLLVGVGSRGVHDEETRAENVMVDAILSVLDTRTPEGVLYGTLALVELDRAVRTRVGEALLTHRLQRFDIRLVLTTGVRDPVGDPGFDFSQMVDGKQAQDAVRMFVRRTVSARVAGHESGRNTYPFLTTNALVFVHPESKAMSWNREVVGPVRRAAELIQAGASWANAAAEVGHLIPSRVLQAQSDTKRIKRNQQRLARGLPAVELKLLDDGNPNPAYIGETLADEVRPERGLKILFVSHLHQPSARIDAVVDTDLGGIDVRQSRLEFLVHGVFRRLVEDTAGPDMGGKRLQWVAWDLGPVDESRGVLTEEQFNAVWPTPTQLQTRQGSAGFTYLRGVFEVDHAEPIYSRHGWLEPSKGRWRCRSRYHKGIPGYTLQFEPATGRPSWQAIGSVEADLLHRDVKDQIAAALASGPVPIKTGWVKRAERRRLSDQTLRRQVAHAELLLRQALNDYSQPNLSDPKRKELLAISDEREATLLHLQAKLAATGPEATQAGDDADGIWHVGKTVDLMAVLDSGRKFSPEATRAIQATARDVLRNGKIWVDLGTGRIRWSADLTLTGEDVTIRRRIGGSLRNQRRDRWTDPMSLERVWWDEATTFAAPKIPPGITTLKKRWGADRNRIAERIDTEAALAGVKLRPAAARAIMHCPDWDITRMVIRIVQGRAALDDVRTQYFASLIVDDGDEAPEDLSAIVVTHAWRRAFAKAPPALA